MINIIPIPPTIFETIRSIQSRFRPVPFWFWNGDLKKYEISRQIFQMDSYGIGSFIIHARTGLRHEDYLSKYWMECVRSAADYAEQLGMRTWLYDEYNWPSGFADGIVSGKGEEYLQKFLRCTKYRKEDFDPEAHHSQDIMKIFALNPRTFEYDDITETASRGLIESDEILVFRRELFTMEGAQEAHITNGYIDTLNPYVVNAFIESTYLAYHKAVGKSFGGSIPVIFNDEPSFRAHELGVNNMKIPWTDGFPIYFKKKCGYNILDKLPYIFFKNITHRKIRFDFWRTVSDLFDAAYVKQLYDWCSSHNIKLCGHFLMEDAYPLSIKTTGNLMQHYRYYHIPGIDYLLIDGMSTNVLLFKQMVSAAHQLGRDMALSEAFGGGGWKVTLSDIKIAGDLNYALGINVLCSHAFYYTLSGNTKRDWPPAFSYQQPFAEISREIWDYFSKLSNLLTVENRVADVLIMNPVSSLFCIYEPQNPGSIRKVNDYFMYLVNSLPSRIDFDLGDEVIMSEEACVEGNTIFIGKAAYKVVVVPFALNIRRSTMDILTKFVDSGGLVVTINPVPTMVDGEFNDEVGKFFKEKTTVVESDKGLIELLEERNLTDIRITGDGSDNIVYNHCKWPDIDVYFIVNNNTSSPANINLNFGGDSRPVYKVDIIRNSCEPLPANPDLYLLPGQSALLILMENSVHPADAAGESNQITLPNEWRFKRNSPNIYRMGLCNYRINSGDWQVPVQPFTIKSSLKTGDHLEEKFEFWVDYLPEELFIVTENPEKFGIFVNDNEIEVKEEGCFVDISFIKIRIQGEFIQTGKNSIRLVANFDPDINIEEVYLIGDFAVYKTQNDAGSYYTISREPVRLFPGAWLEQGYPFYTGSMVFEQDIELEESIIDRCYLTMGCVRDMLKVNINNKKTGTLVGIPYSLDITSNIKSGTNTLEIEIFTNLNNMLASPDPASGEYPLQEFGLPVDISLDTYMN